MESALQSGFASASLQVLFDKLPPFALNELGLLWGVDDELDKLERTMLKIQVLLDDLESKNIINNKALQIWIQDLKSLFLEADDLLDDVSLQLLKLNIDESIRSRNRNQVRDRILSSLKLTLPHEINKLQKKLENVVSEMDSPLTVQMIHLKQSKSLRRPSSSLVNESSVIGRNGDKESISRILSSDANSSISVITICGMGGVGKTTLAQMVYNDQHVVSCFDMRIWVSVSFKFDIIDVTKSMLESITGKQCKLSDLNVMQVKVRSLLMGKTFFLVLDDVWNDNTTDWNTLRLPFENLGARGSKILVTTRSMMVSEIVVTSHFHSLQPLSDEDCWTIIKRKAFLNKTTAEQQVLGVIGEEIARKCKGIPLAAQTLGSVLYFKSKEMQWESVMRSELWDLPDDKNDIFSTLKLSYDHLPARLKRCFAYCSNFPLNHEFDKDELVLLWVAEGLVEPSSLQRIEDVGGDYFDELFWRSFFHLSYYNQFDRPIYKIHTLIHNLAQLVCSDTSFTMQKEMPSLLSMFNSVPSLSLICKQVNTTKVLSRYKFARSILLSVYGSQIIQVPYTFFVHLQSLRVLDLSCTGISIIPDSIGSLRHLRYLNVSKTNIAKLPDSVTNLYGLQTLKLKDCRRLFCLPNDTKNLTKLRHLDLDIKSQLSSMPSEFGKLTCLQGLNAFIVGKGKGYQIEELMNMKDLRGSICITNLENVVNMDDAKKARLEDKTCIEKLELEWNLVGNATLEQEVLTGLRPQDKLQELYLKGYRGFMFPDWFGNPSFCKLKSISLTTCYGCTLFPNLGRLHNLKSLYIHKMYNLEYWDLNLSRIGQIPQFPSLEILQLHDMPNLRRWEGMHSFDMPRLNQLHIECCPDLVALPSLHQNMSLAAVYINRCSGLQSLPQEGLPLSLNALIISECDILKERCKVEEGEDWNKIRMISYVEIDGEIHIQG